MSSFANRIAALEVRMLAKFGANGTITNTSTTYDPVADRIIATTGESRTVRMTVGPSETRDEEGREVWATTASMTSKPEQGETLVFAGNSYTVGHVETFWEADLPVLYKATLS